jgi:hypothetical protein
MTVPRISAPNFPTGNRTRPSRLQRTEHANRYSRHGRDGVRSGIGRKLNSPGGSVFVIRLFKARLVATHPQPCWPRPVSNAGELVRMVPMIKNTGLSRAFTGRLARGLYNRFASEMKAHGPLFAKYPAQSWILSPLRAAALAQGCHDLISFGLIPHRLRRGSLFPFGILKDEATGFTECL